MAAVLCTQAESWQPVPPMARVTKPKGGMATKLMGVETTTVGSNNSDHALAPTLKTRALYASQTGMGGNPNRTPARSRLKIQTKWSYKKIFHIVSCTPQLVG